MKILLALDLGTSSTGYAVHNGDHVTGSGRWALPGGRPVAAYAALRANLRAMLGAVSFDVVAYEDVPGNIHDSGASAHRWGGFEAVVLLACVEHRVPQFLGVNPATWKAAAGLGSGTCARAALAAARKRWPTWRPTKGRGSEDEAVARWVAVAAAGRVA